MKSKIIFAYKITHFRHIEEDSQVLTREMVSRMSPEELEFHYFSSHDFDRNSKLDGLEMLKVHLIFVSLMNSTLL